MPRSPELRQRLHDPLLVALIQIRTVIAPGIVFLMTTKPDVVGSALATGVSIAVGVALSFPALSRARLHRLQPVGQQDAERARLGRRGGACNQAGAVMAQQQA